MAMTDEQIERYSRHIILNEVGVKGQKKLLKGIGRVYVELIQNTPLLLQICFMTVIPSLHVCRSANASLISN